MNECRTGKGIRSGAGRTIKTTAFDGIGKFS